MDKLPAKWAVKKDASNPERWKEFIRLFNNVTSSQHVGDAEINIYYGFNGRCGTCKEHLIDFGPDTQLISIERFFATFKIQHNIIINHFKFY